ncbi:HlyD family secretion protein [Archangium lansingense]|uniref:HlyD family efflux transporter periplasmic adaptor subunit n=1 Tax=Archangium lansingense TaxID=2995310 RepID=A0ABT4AKY5_9BACT|nr:HlyD family efflux transporter periplasmic adaptor subunit [Archangium lansinium]MCY1082364.1 HlyD family efflux transporter periplasmic adaptor subunit [Archangium lansinium]
MFPRTLRTLLRRQGRLALWLLPVGLIAVWGSWFLLARVTVYERSVQARLELHREVYAIDAPADGRVVGTQLELHRSVHAGDVLVELEHDQQARQVAEAEAVLQGLGPQLEAARAELEAEQSGLVEQKGQGAAGVEEAQARLTDAEAVARRARKEAASFEQLWQRGVVSEMEWSRVRTELERSLAAEQAARASLMRVRSEGTMQSTDRRTRIAALLGEIARLEAEEGVARANLERLREELDRRVVRAPAEGILGETSSIRVGTQVKAGDPIATVVAGGPVRIVAQFSPEALGRIRAGQSARMQLEGFSWTEFGMLEATVVAVASEAREGLVRVELSVDELPAGIPLEHGLPGNVDISVGRSTPLQLVLRAMGQGLDGPARQHPRALPVTAETAAPKGGS